MSKLNNLSRAGWLVVGVVVTLLLVPTMAVAATVTYNGIEGTNGKTTTQNKALVTSAGQLLTTEAPPQKYVIENANVESDQGTGNGCGVSAGGYYDCEPIGPSPSAPTGDALVIDSLVVDAVDVNAPLDLGNIGVSGTADNSSQSVVYLRVIPSGDNNGNPDCIDDGSTVVEVNVPNGTPGTLSLPFTPGYVVPTGYSLCILGIGLGGNISFNGYFVPSADAPTTPQVPARGSSTLPRLSRPNPRDSVTKTKS